MKIMSAVLAGAVILSQPAAVYAAVRGVKIQVLLLIIMKKLPVRELPLFRREIRISTRVTTALMSMRRLHRQQK